MESSLGTRAHEAPPPLATWREQLSPTLTWLFEGPGYAYVTLTVDAIVLLAAIFLADALNPEPSYPAEFLVSPLALVLIASRRLYDPHAQRSRLDRVAAIAGSTGLAALVVAGLIQIAKPAATDSDLIAIQFAIATSMLIAWRVSWATVRLRVRDARLTGRPTLIIGAGEVGSRIERHLREIGRLGLIPVGFIDADPVDANEIERREAPVLGAPDAFDAIVDDTGTELAIFAFQIDPDVTLRRLVHRCEQRDLDMAIVPRLFDDATNRMVLEHVGGIPLFELRRVDPRGWEFALKHGLDRVVSALLLILLSPVILATALAVRVLSGSPVLFRQRRVGRDGREFDVLKFRSMRGAPNDDVEVDVGAEARAWGDAAPGGIEGEDRRTPIGRFIRTTKLDELPQLVNVIRGQMSLVGPRPERPELAEEYIARVRRYDERLRVRSGITGWAQVNGLGPGTSLADRAEWDNWYIQNWSFWLDFKIILMTIPAVFRGSE